MTTWKSDLDHDHDHDNEQREQEGAATTTPAEGATPANDNDKKQREQGNTVAPAPAGGAMTSLAALGAALNKVDTASVIGRSGLPMLSFKREGDGCWMYGRRKTVVEDDSHWAANPFSFQYGWICFGDNKKVLGERLVSATQPMPNVAELPNLGFPWVPEWCVNLKCLDGADAGLEVTYKTTTDGGVKAVAGLINTVRERINSGQHDGKVSPVLLLHKDTYPHSEHGRQWVPVPEIVDWIPLSGPTPPAPAPAPASPPEPTPQPRRRRVG